MHEKHCRRPVCRQSLGSWGIRRGRKSWNSSVLAGRHCRHVELTNMIGYGRQAIDRDDIDAVVAALSGDYLTQGPTVDRFEAALAERCGARYAIAVSSGSAALHVACLAGGIERG